MLNRFFSEVPFFRIFLPFLIGLISGFTISLERNLLIIFILFVLLALITDLLFKFSAKFSREWIFGALIQLILIAVGSLIVDLKLSQTDYRKYVNSNNDLVIADLTEYPESKPNSYKIIANVKGVRINEKWQQTRGKCLIYFRKDSNSANLLPGDRIIFISTFSEIQFNRNPYEFNYRKYMHRNSVYKQIFLETGDWEKIGAGFGNPLMLAGVKTQHNLFQKYKDQGMRNDVLNVAGALTLGLRENLGDQIKQSYRYSGAVHILAISGLHVGILYVILFWLLSFLKRLRWGKVPFVIIILSALWFFALLTGLSPSVRRASTMFSFILIGQTFRRNSNVFNSLAVSAFFLLLIDPYLIFNVGFRLSYFAVLGIVILQPRLHNIFRSRYWIVDKISGLFAVSIAAQLATFPLTLYYFNQFPVYFWLTNIIVIPFTILILYSGLVFFVFSFQPFIAGFLVNVLSLLVNGLNSSVETIRDLPYSIIHNVHISTIETIIIYSLIIFLCIYIINKRPANLMATLFFILFLITINLFQQYNILKRESIVIYNIDGITAVNFIKGRTSFLMHDANNGRQKEQLKYYTENHLNSSGIQKLITFPLDSLATVKNQKLNKSLLIAKGFLKFFDQRIFVYFTNAQNRFTSDKKIKVNSLLYSNTYGTKLNVIRKQVIFENVIISSSVPEWKANLIIDECKKMKVSCHRITREGPVILNL